MKYCLNGKYGQLIILVEVLDFFSNKKCIVSNIYNKPYTTVGSIDFYEIIYFIDMNYTKHKCDFLTGEYNIDLLKFNLVND